jgi:hypothetical protein
MFDGKPIEDTQFTQSPPPIEEIQPTQSQPPPARSCYFGLDGLLEAITRLNQLGQGLPPQIKIYLSLDHSRLFRDKELGKLFETLWTLGGKVPVRMYFDKWDDTDEAVKTLRTLLAYMQKGWLRLHLVATPEKMFYTNILFLAEGAGVIVTTEPAGDVGNSVSMLVESRDYLKNMSLVLTKFDRASKQMEKHLSVASTRDETGYFKDLFEPTEDLKGVIDGANLLYLEPIAYLRLLKINHVTGTQREYRLDRFAEDKSRFETFLQSNRLTEIFSLPRFDQMISSLEIKTPDFSFHNGTVKSDPEILKNLFTGMLDYLNRFPKLSVYLNHKSSPMPNLSCRLKGDRFILLHSFNEADVHIVYSETWLLIYEYFRFFEEALQDDVLITIRNNVKAALKIRLEKLEVLRDE